ncbi:hypothetical protein [Micromonospora sp. NPDC049900]|uniref:hypothetical protein n=1 Tax=unclassified Micromonospora TaxID=2617518 RepID=UPI0037B72F91
MSHRILPALVLVAVTAALTACGGGEKEQSSAGDPTSAPPPASAPATAPAPSQTPSSAPPAAEPTVTGSTERRPPSPPPVKLPPRKTGEPSAREVVAAFRAAGLKAGKSKDRSVDCGPDGLGLGCSEIVVTDGVAVYVFPDEVSASDMAEVWAGASFRSGTVVLNYLEARTPRADRPGYEKALTDLD